MVRRPRPTPPEDTYKRHSGTLSTAVMLLQIGIMLSSISGLLKMKPLWAVGLGFGGAGGLFMANGFGLWL